MEFHEEYLRISLCTVSMNRLHHFKKTTPENIRLNINYPNLQHIILDYNSVDGTDEWIQKTLNDHIDTGRLVYYKTDEPDSFHGSHARNMVFRLAEEGIICNIDADNYTGDNFAQYLNKHFCNHTDGYLTTNYNAENRKFIDASGRIACLKKDFLAVGGYDEQMIGWGYEDFDLYERLKRYGLKQYHILNESYLESISHSDEERQVNEKRSNQIRGVYLHFIDPFNTQIIFLFNDHTFSMATLIDNQEGFGIPLLAERRWNFGVWEIFNKDLFLKYKKQNIMKYKIGPDGNLIDEKMNIFYLISNKDFRIKLKKYYPMLTNHQLHCNNMKDNIVRVNDKNFGCGQVVQNFKEKIELK